MKYQFIHSFIIIIISFSIDDNSIKCIWECEKFIKINISKTINEQT